MVPVLDHGFIRKMQATFPGHEITELSQSFGRNSVTEICQLVHLTLHIKSPLFVQIFLSSFNLCLLPKRHPDKELKAYVPTFADIGSQDRQANIDVAEYMKETTEALILNASMFAMNGCNNFITQTITPVSVYNEIIVDGSLDKWIRLVQYRGLPHPIEEYRKAIHNILKGEWPTINDFMRGVS